MSLFPSCRSEPGFPLSILPGTFAKGHLDSPFWPSEPSYLGKPLARGIKPDIAKKLCAIAPGETSKPLTPPKKNCRKALSECAQAFLEAFSGDQDVELRIHSKWGSEDAEQMRRLSALNPDRYGLKHPHT